MPVLFNFQFGAVVGIALAILVAFCIAVYFLFLRPTKHVLKASDQGIILMNFLSDHALEVTRFRGMDINILSVKKKLVGKLKVRLHRGELWVTTIYYNFDETTTRKVSTVSDFETHLGANITQPLERVMMLY